MHVSRNKVERVIEKRLTEAINREKPRIGPVKFFTIISELAQKSFPFMNSTMDVDG